MIIKNGKIHDAINPEVYVADIAMENGKITAIGKNLVPAPGEEVLDATGKEVYPGFVDAHSHLGLHRYSVGKNGTDINERGSGVGGAHIGAHIRGIDAFDTKDKYIRNAVESGVTTICTGPGSANIIGGTFLAVKTAGGPLKKMVINADVAMKAAFGENVIYQDRKFASTRLGVAAILRQTLYDAKDYLARKEAADPGNPFRTDLRMEALIPVIKGEMPLKCHVHEARDICTALRIREEFGLKMTLEHVTDGPSVLEELVEANVPIAIGPMIFRSDKRECENRTHKTAAILSNAGLKVSIVTDATVTPVELLTFCVGLAMKHGMDPHKALQAITITAAEHIGIADRVGSLEVGKDADVVIADGDLLRCIQAKVETVFVNGEKVVG